MRNNKIPALKLVNQLVVVVSIVFTVFVMYMALVYFINHEQKWMRTALLSLVLAAYIAVYLLLSAKKGVHWLKTLIFMATYVVLGLSVNFALHGYSKGWAPASNRDATQATLAWLLVILSIVCTGIYSFSRTQHKNPSKPLQRTSR